MLVEVAGDEMSFASISRAGKAVDRASSAARVRDQAMAAESTPQKTRGRLMTAVPRLFRPIAALG